MGVIVIVLSKGNCLFHSTSKRSEKKLIENIPRVYDLKGKISCPLILIAVFPFFRHNLSKVCEIKFS